MRKFSSAIIIVTLILTLVAPGAAMAKDDLSGRHNFAVTHAEHARNAARYQRALNERGIY